MPKLDAKHAVNHKAIEMYALVCDVEQYPQFVPLCKTLNIISSKQKGDKTLIIADMTMAYKMFSETFTTQVLMNRDALTIDVKYIEGPFKHLDNHWSFCELPDEQCEITFTIDYELKSKLLGAAAGAMFEKAFSHFVEAFEKRADEIYGEKT